MKRLIILLAALFLLSLTYGQTTIDLTFTAIDGGDYTQLDSIKVMNRTQGGDTVLYYPDTVLSLIMTGINEFIEKESGFHLFQNYPNPVREQSTVSVQIPTSGKLNITISDILGRTKIKSDHELEKGTHSFRFTPGDDDIYFFTARYKNENRSIKILCSPIRSGKHISINYLGNIDENTDLKASSHIQNFFYNYGDELLYVGYYDTLQSGMLDSPEESNTYMFQFAFNIPCPGTPTVDYEGQIYNTVQIMSQCWLKENLNVGLMIQGSEHMSDNDTIEKYCYYNKPDSCSKYGGLYQWDEIMRYTTQQGAKGICPPGWHLPTDEEWKVLEGSADTQYGVGDSTWDGTGIRGYDTGKRFKTSTGWDYNGNGTNVLGFSALPGGYHDNDNFGYIGNNGYWWSGTEYSSLNAWYRILHHDFDGVHRFHGYGSKPHGQSVRCIKDTSPSDNFTELTFTAYNNADYVQLDSIKVMNRTHEGEKVLVYPDTTITLEFDLPNYHTGDQLLLVGYYDTLQSGMIDIPEESKTYTFQFAYGIPCPNTTSVTDVDGNTYNTVQIGNQCWMKENLKTTKYRNGSSIPNVTIDSIWSNLTTGAYKWYNNDTSWKDLYGALYNWYTTEDTNRLCPLGWHMPTYDELTELTYFVGGTDSPYGNKLKSCLQVNSPLGGNCNTTNHPRWDEDNSDWGTDVYGFSGLPGGLQEIQEDRSVSIGGWGLWWSSEIDPYNSITLNLHYNNGGVGISSFGKEYGMSVRCIKD